MTIETKYNIGDEVFMLLHRSVDKYNISGIRIRIEGGNTSVEYRLRTIAGNTDYYDESWIFPTKEELLKSL